ncbi:bifunctional protein FolD protein [Oxobacter pfennigii]|uniref:Bifunctional protein FolD n=1 Tax=Oxobacter pfennigii TaxID=36849 RepID=A0A0P8WJW2_9CLOT|nr:tetrahydrofolate dehydrogenase/cyclohydrolase catalytic domain-containing protein [Oxobacter pfennigii]KPU42458.1 bifunctional protein FolD protein [Oxobacter pfennigii]
MEKYLFKDDINSMELINCKEIAHSIEEETIEKIKKLKQEGVTPTLAIVKIGDDEGNISYQKSITKKCKSMGIGYRLYEISNDEKNASDKYLSLIDSLNGDESIHGIMVLIPKGSAADAITRINPIKDVDNITGKGHMYPCTAEAVIAILDYINVNLEGKDVAIMGKSNKVGKPVAEMMMDRDATVTVCHAKTADTPGKTRQADILVVAIGVPKFVTQEYVKEGAIVIDVGINLDENGRLCGDVNLDSIKEKAGACTPAVNGVGAVTTAMLMKSIYLCAYKQTMGEIIFHAA